MLELKPTAFGTPETEDHFRLADWIEANLICQATDDGQLSRHDIEDLLSELEVVPDQDSAARLVSDALSLMVARRALIGEMYPVAVADQVVLLQPDCPDPTPYALCLTLSLSHVDRDWARSALTNAPRALFEELTFEALQRVLPAWQVIATGWAGGRQKGEIVNHVADALHERVIRADLFENANDGQLDVFCWREFPDRRGGYPAMFVQSSTSRTEWNTIKLAEPNMNRWRQAVALRNLPNRAIAVPFSVSEGIFDRAVVDHGGLVLDRIRLVGALGTPLGAALRARISEWLPTALGTFPRLA